jgi:hypothetical protein
MKETPIPDYQRSNQIISKIIKGVGKVGEGKAEYMRETPVPDYQRSN